jgi:ribose-phosphate pyrophosphokinase
MGYSYIKCSKVRDIETGSITSFSIDEISYSKDCDEIVVIDDLCDGGGTFVGIASKLRELKPSKLTLVVTHAVQKAGIERVAKVYDQVVITNSYKNWDNLPENVRIMRAI